MLTCKVICFHQTCQNIEPEIGDGSEREKEVRTMIEARKIEIFFTYQIPEFLGHVKIFTYSSSNLFAEW